MERLGKKQFSSETYKKIHWVLQMYHSWRLQCNCQPDLPTVFADFDNYSTLSKSSVCYGISCFVTEILKINGEEFPLKILYEMVMCFQMHLKSLGLFWKLLDDHDRSFITLKYTVDNLMKERASSGDVYITKKAKVLSYDDEELLWEKGLLGSSTCENTTLSDQYAMCFTCWR